MADFLQVKPGDPVSADKWNQFLKSIDRTNVLYGGDNMSVNRTPHGSIVNAKHARGFLHPWRVTISDKFASVHPGLINGQYPTINDKLMTDRPTPLIELSRDKFNNGGIGWIALELETQKNEKDNRPEPNKYAEIKTVEIRQVQYIIGSEAITNKPFFYVGFPGIGDFKVRYPLARLQLLSQGIQVYQVAMFNLNWFAKPPNPSEGGTGADAIGSAFPRHFFWPA